MESLKEIKNKILEDVSFLDLETSEYEFRDFIKGLKQKFIHREIKKHNVFNIQKHDLKNNYSNNIIFKSVWDDDDFNFKDIRIKIEEYFKTFTKEDKIKEVMPIVQTDKIFNEDKVKYFSIWDYQKKFKDSENKLNKEEMFKDIENKINPLKEVCLSSMGLTDNYYRTEKIREILEFLKYAYNIEIEIGDLYNKPLKEIEKELNTKELKVRLFNEWFYLSFTEKYKQENLKQRVITELKRRLVRD